MRAKHRERRDDITPVLGMPAEQVMRMLAESGIVSLLNAVGEDTERDGLKDTPRRVVNAMLEMTSGYMANVAEILSTTFEQSFDEMIAVRSVPFWSLCEHHLLPFHGYATVAYIPGESKRVVGLSKIARVVHAYAKRLQVQERLTQQIALALMEHLSPKGVGVLVEGVHSCMAARGAKVEAPMVTSYLGGAMRDDPKARAEFFDIAKATRS